MAETFTMNRKQARMDTEVAASIVHTRENGNDASIEIPKEKLILSSEGG